MIINFILAVNSSQQTTPTVPVETDDIFYVSATGTGNGLTAENPMSVEDYDSLELTDNSIVLFKAGEEL